jgi:hypothetical protein
MAADIAGAARDKDLHSTSVQPADALKTWAQQ